MAANNNGSFAPMPIMGSVAALLNPANSEEVLLFYCTETYNLAVEHRALSEKSQSTVFQDNNINQGAISQPGDFAAIIGNSLIKCYGITNFKGGDGHPYSVVSMVSPVENPIDTISVPPNAAPSSPALCGNYSAVAATTDSKFVDFVAFIQPNPQTPGLPLLVEYTCNVSATSSETYATPSYSLLPTTRLAMCFRADDPAGNRFIFAQSNAAGNPLVFMSTDDVNFISIKDTNDASPGNPMAVTTVMTPDNVMNIYLFYMNNANNLCRVTYNGANKTWFDKKQVANGLQAGSGITVVNDGKNCYAYYAQKGARVFTMYHGPL